MAHEQARPPVNPLADDPLLEAERDEDRQEILRPGRTDPDGDKAQGKATRAPEEIATRRNLDGSHQGPY
jgi:hypothetical protein